MLKKMLVGIVMCTVVCWSMAYAGDEIDLREGQWEITSKVEMQGMSIPPMTFTQCITQANAVPQGDTSGQADCKVVEMKIVDNTVNWTMVCNGQGGQMTSKGTITYQGDRFEGQMTTETMGMTTLAKMSGKRIGDCQ
ncbi:conserved exported hypothetical protein [Desulfosarcina cetonica]|uniref:DUF3617 domain-containing protein n=1 Tax=Desulfosarcina cetonica TaxID=90730 RepID=UPI0006CF6262|nr:DUF3617 family protein [Desulfosarcina cetonica]VTR65354.1 conserved exported hypothetical protein [Desulfosarcina cetonica]